MALGDWSMVQSDMRHARMFIFRPFTAGAAPGLRVFIGAYPPLKMVGLDMSALPRVPGLEIDDR